MLKIFNKIKSLFSKFFFDNKWTCNICDKEIFNGKYFCDECEKNLPFITGSICAHCGRKTIAPEEYCSTCKNNIVDIDFGRSVFNYSSPINRLIINYKFNSKRYLAEIFGEYLSNVYFKNYFRADVIVYVPMTDKAKRKRGYNQSELLARELSKRTGVPIVDAIIKKRDTDSQTKLSRLERFKSLRQIYKVTDKSVFVNKKVLIVDMDEIVRKRNFTRRKINLKIFF